MQARQDLLDRARRCWLPRSRYSTATASYRSPTARPYPSDTDTAFPWDQFGSLCGLWHLGQCTGEGGGACCRWPRRVNSIDSRRPDRIIWPAGWIGAIHTPRWANSSSRPGVGRWKMQCTMHLSFSGAMSSGHQCPSFSMAVLLTPHSCLVLLGCFSLSRPAYLLSSMQCTVLRIWRTSPWLKCLLSSCAMSMHAPTKTIHHPWNGSFFKKTIHGRVICTSLI